MKKVLMIHECSTKFTHLPLENYVLTFDDGLFSQYVFYQEIKHISTPKIFFISSNIICQGSQSLDYPACSAAHKKAFSGNKEDYMTLEQIKELQLDPWVTIGAHSHDHTRLTQFSSLAEKVKHIQQDTESMIKWFEENLEIRPRAFCFPYNEDLDGLYKGLLKKWGFTDFYGNERTPIEMLLRTQSQLETRDTLPAWSLPRYS